MVYLFIFLYLCLRGELLVDTFSYWIQRTDFHMVGSQMPFFLSLHDNQFTLPQEWTFFLFSFSLLFVLLVRSLWVRFRYACPQNNADDGCCYHPSLSLARHHRDHLQYRFLQFLSSLISVFFSIVASCITPTTVLTCPSQPIRPCRYCRHLSPYHSFAGVSAFWLPKPLSPWFSSNHNTDQPGGQNTDSKSCFYFGLRNGDWKIWSLSVKRFFIAMVYGNTMC